MVDELDEPQEQSGVDLTPEQLENFRIVYEGLRHPPSTAAELYRFLLALTGERVPFKSVCPDHNTPWDYIWKSYKIDLPNHTTSTKRDLIAVGPRGGHKTLSEAKLITGEMLLKEHCETVGMGAVLQQADRCFAYVARYLKHPVIIDSGIIKKLLSAECELANGSKYEQVCATISGVNSPHNQKLRMDEVDLIPKEVIEEAKMIPSSHHNLTGHTAYCSTRKTIDGTMVDLIEEGKMRDYEILTWCIKDVSEPCPESRRGTQKRAYDIEDIFNPGESMVVEAYEGCKDCPLLSMCRGDLANATGLVPIKDTIRDWKTMDRETFMVQKLCRNPSMAGMFFNEFDERVHTGIFDYNPNLPLDLFIDFTNGGESPTRMQLWQEDNQEMSYCLASRDYVNKTTRRSGQDFIDFCAKLGVYSAEQFRIQVGDSANPQAIKDYNSMFPDFFKIKSAKKVERVDGWPLCRRALRDNDGYSHTLINRRHCHTFIDEIKNAKHSRRDPSDISNACADHDLDCWRYREVWWRYKKNRSPGIRLPVLPAPPDRYPDGNIIVPPSKDDHRSFFDRVMDADGDD